MRNFLKFLSLGFFACSLSMAQLEDSQLLTQIQKNLEQKSWERLSVNIQKILSRHTGGDFSPLKTYPTQVCGFVAPEENAEYPYAVFHVSSKPEIVRPEYPVLQMGAHLWAEEILLNLEDDALQFYREKFDLQCNDVQQAIDSQNIKRLAKIAREFLFSSYGPTALQALSEFCLDQNEPEIAISYLKRLFTYRGDTIKNRTLTLCKLAYAYHLLEDNAGLVQCKQWMKELLRTEELITQSKKNGKTLSEKQLRVHYARLFRNEKLSLEQEIKIRLDKIPPPDPVLIAGKQTDPSRYIEQLLEKNRLSVPENWSSYGGNFQRNAFSDTDFSKLEGQFKWTVSLPRIPYKNKVHGMPNFMPYQPVVADGTVYINTGLGLRAYNLFDGKEKWPEYKGFLSKSVLMDEIGSEGSLENLILSATVDDEQIYLNVEKIKREADTFNPGTQTFNIQPIFPIRTLVCVDSNTGKQKWAVQTENTLFHEANFSSAPLVYKNFLFCEANFYEGLVRSYLLCLDKYTGKIVYSLLISSGQTSLNMFGRPIRESVSTCLSEKEGILYFSNILGVLVAVEAYSGTILWILRYPQSPLSSPTNYEDSERPQQWYNNPILIQDDLILLAPPDSPQIMAINRFSGKMIWRRERNMISEKNPEEKKFTNRPWNLRYLLGVADGKVFLSGDAVVALEVNTGRLIWKTSEYDFSQFSSSGRGILSSRYLYIPQPDWLNRFSFDGTPAFKTSVSSTSDTDKGVIKTWKWVNSDTAKRVFKGGGNLVMWNGAMITASENTLNVFFDFQQTEQMLEQSIQKDPQNLQQMLQLASLYLYSQNFVKAEEYFLKAKATAAQTKSVKTEQKIYNGLYRTYIAKAEQERRFAKKVSFYQEALKVAQSLSEEIPIYLALIESYKDNRDKKNVIDCWKTLIEKYGNQDYLFSDELVKIAPYALDQMAEYYIEQKEVPKAIDCYQQLLEHHPSDILQYQEGASFAERKIKSLIQQFGRSVYAEQEQKAKTLFAYAQKQTLSESYYRVLKLYPNSEIRESCQFALIEKMLEEKVFSEDILNQIKYLLQNYPESPRRPQLFFYLFQVYYQQGKITQAKNTLRLLAEKYPQNPICWQQETFLIENWLQTLQDKRLKNFTALSQEADLVLSENPSLFTWLKRLSPAETLSLLLPVGTPPESYDSRFYALNGTTLYCFSAHQPDYIWVRGLNFKPEKLLYQDQSLVLLGKKNVLSLLLKEGTTEEQWEVSFPKEAKDILVYQDIFATVYSEKNSLWLAFFDVRTGKALENPIEVCSDNKLKPKLHVTQDFIVVGIRAPVRYYVYSLASMTLQTVIEGNSVHPPGGQEGLILEPNLFCFMDREIVGSEEIIVLKAYNLSRTGSKAEPLWVNTKFSRLNPALLVGKGDTLGVQQEMSDVKKQQILALDAKTGAIRWQYAEPLNSISSVLWDWDYIFFVTMEIKNAKVAYRIVCLRATDGELLWKSSQLPSGRIELQNTKNYVGCQIEEESSHQLSIETCFILFDKATGKMLRKYELKGKGSAEDAIVVDTALVLTKDSTIYSYTSK